MKGRNSMEAMTGRMVYESRATIPKRRKKGGDVVRYRLHGLMHRQTWHGGGYRTEVLVGQRWRMILNQELPLDHTNPHHYIAHPQDGVCEKCGHIYSHLMRQAGQPCNECAIQQAAEHARVFEEAGIPLGWGYTPKTSDISADSRREQWRRIQSTDDHSIYVS